MFFDDIYDGVGAILLAVTVAFAGLIVPFVAIL